MEKIYFKYVCILIILISNLIYSQNFWQQTSGPWGGRIQAMVTTPDGSILASTLISARAGLFKSIDNGAHWIDIEERLEYSNHINCFAVDLDGYVYAGNETGGTFYSSDNGESWYLSDNHGFMANHLYVLTVDANNTLFAGADGGIFYSNNHGDTWYSIEGMPEMNTLIINNSGYSYAGSYILGAFRSSDGGNTWVQINNGLPASVDIRSFALASNGDVFTGTNGWGIYRSTNNGNNWVAINNGLTTNYIRHIGLDYNGNLFALTGSGVFRSTNNGDNWTGINEGLTTNDIKCIEINPDNLIFLGTGLGAFFSDNQGNGWMEINTGISGTLIKSLQIDSRDYLWAGSYYNGLFYSNTEGLSWVRINKAIPLISSVLIGLDDEIFVFTSDSVYRSIDYGESWSSTIVGQPGGTLTSTAQNTNGDIFAEKFDEGIFRSTDNGDNWTEVNNGLTSLDAYSLAVNSIGYIFAGTYDGLFRSTDNGASWTELNNGLTADEFDALGINLQDEIFAAGFSDQYFNSIFKSTDNGVSWTENWNLGSRPYIDCFSFNSLGHLFAGASRFSGAYLSTDDGNYWTKISDGFPSYTSVFTLVVDANDYVFAGTESGVYRSVYSTTDTKFSTQNYYSEYRLSQNFPNPFNPSTTINYALPQVSLVQLKVYDILGNEVAVLVNGEKPQGMYEVNFNANRLSSGIYFYRMEANTINGNKHFSKVGKMIFLK